jgi:hypothetical protein
MSDVIPYNDAQNTIQPYLDLVTAEHQKPKYLDTILHSIRGHAQEIELLIRLYELFDIDTAVGQQLDYVGQWIGVTRYITTEMENVFFSWDATRNPVGWEQGTWWQPFTETTELFKLDDEHYRMLLKARIISNHWDGTVPGAYTAWETLFGPDGYHVLIQDGMASVSAEFKFDNYDWEGWDRAAWQICNPSRANFLRNSTLVGAKIGGPNMGQPAVLPTYWEIRTGFNITIMSVYDQMVSDQRIKSTNLWFDGTSIGGFTDLYFEETNPNYLKVSPGETWTLSAYFSVISNSGITGYELVVRTYNDDGSFYRDITKPLSDSPYTFTRIPFTFTIPNNVATIQVGLRFLHQDQQSVALRVTVGQPQLELGSQMTAPIDTAGSPLVVHEPKLPQGYLHSSGHMIYALIAPYTPPPPLPEYFSWDQYEYYIEVGGLDNIKLTSIPTIDPDLAAPPPGLTLCLPCSEQTWAEVANNVPVASSKDADLYVNFTGGVIGPRFKAEGYLSYSWSDFGSQPPSVWTIEVLIHLFSGTEGYIAGFTTYSTVGGVSDRTLYIADGKFGIYVGGGGGPEHIELGMAEPGIHHLIVTCAPPTVTLTIKGQGTISFTTSSTGGSIDYGPIYRGTESGITRISEFEPAPAVTSIPAQIPKESEGTPFFVIGRAKIDAPYPQMPQSARTFDGVVMLANVSTTAYSAEVIADRFADPYSFLWWVQPDKEIITYIDYAKGWDDGVWDVTPALVEPPPIDSVLMALFTGGYIDLRPAGVTIEYVTQSLAGTPIFAFDNCGDDQQIEMNYLTWDGDDYNGWDSAVWDLTPIVYNTDFPAPPYYVAGWDIGAWGNFAYTAPALVLPEQQQLADLREAA